jgi:hypothetical protein
LDPRHASHTFRRVKKGVSFTWPKTNFDIDNIEQKEGKGKKNNDYKQSAGDSAEDEQATGPETLERILQSREEGQDLE